jgi:hypothetical protein
MKKYTVLSLVFSLFCSVAAWAQTADEVVNLYVQALGGKDKLASIKSVYMEGVTVMQNGNELTARTYKVQDQLYRREMELGAMGNMTQIVTPEKGWFSNPRNGGAFEAMPEEMMKGMKGEMDCTGPLVNYAAKGNKIELLGKETVDGKECYKLKCTPAVGSDILYFIEVSTGYLLRETRKGRGGMMGGGRPGGPGGNAGGETEFNIDYKNYQKTADGYVFPYTVTMGGRGAGTTMEKIEVNKAIDVKAMSKPAQ